MAILDRITCGEKEIFSVDTDPRTSGFLASKGSFAALDNGTNGLAFLKTGDGNTDWELIITGNDLEDVIEDIIGSLVTDTASISWDYDDVAGTLEATVLPAGVSHNGLADLQAAADGVTHGHITDAAQTIKGAKTFTDDMVVSGNLTVNGTTTTVHTEELVIKDPLITLNDGGTTITADNSGIEIEGDTGAVVAHVKVEGSTWKFNTITSSFEFKFDSTNLTATHNFLFPNENGTFILRGPTAGVDKQVAFFDGTLLASATGTGDDSLIWDAGKFGIATSAPKGILHRKNFYENAFTTTSSNATPVIATSLAVPSDTIVTIEVRINGCQTAGSGGTIGNARGYVRTATVKNIGGTSTLLKVQSDFTAEDESTGDVRVQLTGNTIEVAVIGGANRDITWYGHYSVLETPAT